MNDNTKILIIRLSAIGDTIHTLPMLSVLKNKYPDCKIGWVVENKAKMFVENNPLIDKYFIIDKKKKNFFEIIKQIRNEKYDIALDSQQLFKSGIILGLCGAKKKITLSGGRELSFIFANKIVKAKTKLFDTNYHVIKRNLELCEYLGCNTDNIEFITPDINSNIDIKFENGKPIVAISPATTWRNKHICNTFWIDIINYLEDKANIIFTGSIKDEKLISHLIESSKNKNIMNYAGKTNLLELKEVFKKCKLVITPDSGSAHIAWAAKIPSVITLFSATSAKRTGPFGDNKKYFSIQSKAECSPCMKKKCVNKNNKEICTKKFDTEEIKKIIDSILN